MTLYHYTCSHAAPGIIERGRVLPLSDLYSGAGVPPWGLFAWFTDLDTPHREGLGLTSSLLACDRTAHRFEVTDTTEVERWVNVHWYYPWGSELESAPGAMPMHWWVATEPVPVKAATR